MIRHSFALVLLLLSACVSADLPASPPTPAENAVSASAPSAGPTRILDPEAAARLLGAKGVTLQWIGWNHRGSVNVREQGDTILLSGAQAEPSGPGRLYLDGRVVEIGSDYFVFDGTIRITDTPDSGRVCELDKQWRFAITQNRPYWRLREFEWCDGLTDYVDIYF